MSKANLAERVATLENENAILREHAANLRDALVEPVAFPVEPHFTKSQRALIGHMLARAVVTRESALDVLYLHKADCPESDTISVFLNRLRTKLKPFGVSIKNTYGLGWHLSPEDKNKLRAHLEKVAA